MRGISIQFSHFANKCREEGIDGIDQQVGATLNDALQASNRNLPIERQILSASDEKEPF